MCLSYDLIIVIPFQKYIYSSQNNALCNRLGGIFGLSGHLIVGMHCYLLGV